VVHSDAYLMLLGKLVHPASHAWVGGGSHYRSTQCLCDEKPLINFRVCHFFAKAIVVSTQLNSRIFDFLSGLFKEGKWRLQPPFAQALSLEVFWLQVSAPKLDTIDASFDNAIDGLVERPVAKAVALNSNLNSIDQ